MESWVFLGWIFALILLVAVGFLGVGLYTLWQSRRDAGLLMKYFLDRLKVAETDLTRATEELQVVKEYLSRRGLLDDEDFSQLRRELIEKPRQIEAEKEELLKGAPPEDQEMRIVKNTPDTVH